jgi:hypothetical protein
MEQPEGEMSRDADRHHELILERIAAKVCTKCGKLPPIKGERRCEKCRAKTVHHRQIERDPTVTVSVVIGPTVWDLLPNYCVGIEAAIQECAL